MATPPGEDSRTLHLRKLLTSFEPGGPEEAGFRDQMRKLLEKGAQGLHRDHYVPGHFTASAFVVDASREHLLLIHHQKLGRWLQPGGHIEPSDADLLRAAEREASEETGVHRLEPVGLGLFDLDVHAIPAFGTAPAHFHFDLRFLFVAPETRLDPSDEVEGARWVPLGELAQVTPDESVLRAARKLEQRALASP